MVGVFDSGVGGLGVLGAIRAELPGADLLYFADRAHLPYGPRPLAEVRAFSMAIASFLLARGARVIVVACHTASAAALHALRASFPEVPFVGMEPAVKPAAEETRTRVVGVLATPATFEGELFARVVERFAADVTVLARVCPGLAERIEAGDLDGPGTEAALRAFVGPLLAQGIDTLVLACTHYPFVLPLLSRIAGPGVRLIDPAPAVARQVRRVVEHNGLAAAARSGRTTYFTSGVPEDLGRFLARVKGPPGEIVRVAWRGGETVREATGPPTG